MSLSSTLLEPESHGVALDSPARGELAFDPMDCSATLMPENAAAAAMETLTLQNLEQAELGETTLAQSVAYLFVLSIAQRAIGFVRGLLVCIWLTPALLGPWDLTNRFFILASPLLVLGIPGSFGRYLEYYRQHGALRSVLRRTTAVCLALCTLGWLAFQVFSEPLAGVFLMDTENAELLRLASTCLLAVVAYNFLVEVLNALRLIRLNALIQFGQSLLFAGLCVAGLAWWRADSTTVIVAYATACAAMLLVGGLSLARQLRKLPADRVILPQRQLWSKLLPFAAWIWVANLLTNLFDSSGRWMLLRWTPDATKLLRDTLAGNYHVAQLIPALMVTLACMLGGTLLPYLARDWESGRRARVSDTMNLAMKLLALALIAGSMLVMAVKPWLFQVAFRGKFDEGEAILHLALAGCVWSALIAFIQTYLWCAERARYGCFSLAIGLAVNVLLHWLWVPNYGIAGSMLATAFSSLAVLGVLFQISVRAGMRLDHGTVGTSLLPGLLLFGLWPAAAGLAVCGLVLAVRRAWLFTPSERAVLSDAWDGLVSKFRRSAG
jgi:O-antigen/teichoic acid export membrane protein